MEVCVWGGVGECVCVWECVCEGSVCSQGRVTW